MPIVITPMTRSMASRWSRMAAPRLPNSTPSATKITVKPSTNSTAPTTMRARPVRASPDSPAT